MVGADEVGDAVAVGDADASDGEDDGDSSVLDGCEDGAMTAADESLEALAVGVRCAQPVSVTVKTAADSAATTALINDEPLLFMI